MISGGVARLRQQQAGLDAAHDFVTRLAAQHSDLCAVVFGSMARGDFHEGSDVDLLLISSQFEADFMRREASLYASSPGNLDLFGYRPEEFLDMLRKNHPTAHAPRAHGVVLRGEARWTELLAGL